LVRFGVGSSLRSWRASRSRSFRVGTRIGWPLATSWVTAWVVFWRTPSTFRPPDLTTRRWMLGLREQRASRRAALRPAGRASNSGKAKAIPWPPGDEREGRGSVRLRPWPGATPRPAKSGLKTQEPGLGSISLFLLARVKSSNLFGLEKRGFL